MLRKRLLAATGVVAALMAALLIAACGGSSKTGATNCPGGTMKMSNGMVMCKSAMSGTQSSTTATTTTGGGKADQTLIHVSTTGSNGAVPTQTLAMDSWQGMTIMAQTRSPIPFLIYQDQRWRIVRPVKHASFHLMIMLNDEHTNAPISYASVWATITNSKGQKVFNNVQWPMNSEYMGPHYGNDVKLPGSGEYKLTVLVSAPAGAYRNGEYKGVWSGSHQVTALFKWNAKTSQATMLGAGKSSMAGMNMSSMKLAINTHVHEVNGVSESPATQVATAYWQGMKIETLTATPTSYYEPVQSSSSSYAVRPVTTPSGADANLMVVLKDRHTGSLLPYATVDATIKDAAGKLVYTGQLKQTISAFSGTYYGSDVKLPAAGRYTATLTIDPPTEGRHVEYEHVWLHPHTLTEQFTWKGK